MDVTRCPSRPKRSLRPTKNLRRTHPMGYTSTMQTVAETPTFTRQASKLFTGDEKQELIDFLAANPLAGDVIPGTGGVRKLRFQVAGTGKRDGSRVIYYYLDKDSPLYALLAYAKSATTDLTPEERRTVATLAASIKTEARSKRP